MRQSSKSKRSNIKFSFIIFRYTWTIDFTCIWSRHNTPKNN